MLGPFIFRWEGKINTKSREAMIIKKRKKSVLSTSFPSLSSAWPSNSRQECGDPLLNCLCFDFFFSPANPATVVTNQFTISLFDVWRKTNKSWDWDLADKTDLSDVFKHRTGWYDKRGAELLWNLSVFFFFFLKDRTRSDSPRQTFQIPLLYESLKCLGFVRQKKKRVTVGFTSI